MTPWWLGLPEAQAVVSCGEHQHRLRWRRGRLEALDHGDPEDERALAALGGQPFACIELLDAWERHKDDLRALVLGARAPGDLPRIDPDSLLPRRMGAVRQRRVGPAVVPRSFVRATGAATAGFAAGSVIGGGFRTIAAPGAGQGAGRGMGRTSKQARGEQELIQLLSLGGGIPDRLLATVAATWSRRSQAGGPAASKARPQLHAALQGRVYAALRSWLSEPTLAAELVMVGAGEQRSLARVEAAVHAELPFDWLLDVWSKGLATIYGRFCLAAETTDGKQWRLSTVAASLDATEQLIVTLPSG